MTFRIVIPLCVMCYFSFTAFKILFIFVFQQFNYNVPRHGFVFILFCLLSILNLQIYVVGQIW